MEHDNAIINRDVRSKAIYGKLFRPSSHERLPGIIVLGGSGGGLRWSYSIAYNLACEGYAALALAYFSYEDLPHGLINIPLEYFQSAFDWLTSQSDIDTEKLTLVGGSRGAELALLLGSYFQEIKAVVGYAPSSVVWGANGGPSSINKPAWTYKNKPVPHMGVRLSSKLAFELTKMIRSLSFGKTFQAVSLLKTALESKKYVEQSRIKVEKINGPILLISGGDDSLLPSVLLAEMVMRRLESYRHPFPYKHLSYKGAGHSINAPGMSLEQYPTKMTHMLTKLICDLGGSHFVNADASNNAWHEVKCFLADQLSCR